MWLGQNDLTNDLNQVSGVANNASTSVGRINLYVGEDKKLHFVNGAGADSAIPFSGDQSNQLLAFLGVTPQKLSVSVSPYLTLRQDGTNSYFTQSGNKTCMWNSSNEGLILEDGTYQVVISDKAGNNITVSCILKTPIIPVDSLLVETYFAKINSETAFIHPFLFSSFCLICFVSFLSSNL